MLHDLGLVSSSEPFAKLVHQGMILGEDGEKMSKSRGNVINPDDIVSQYGGDAMRCADLPIRSLTLAQSTGPASLHISSHLPAPPRVSRSLYEMFMGPLEAVKPWQTEQISGVVRFQARVYALAQRAAATSEEAPMGEETLRLMHQTIQKVTNDVDALGFNTAISSMMVFSNHLQSLPAPPREPLLALTKLLSPFAPHLAEEVWQMLGGEETLAYEAWPSFDPALCVESSVTMGVQVNGKVRGQISLPKDADEATARELALAEPKVARFVDGKEVKKFIYVPGRIVNVVVGK